MNKRTKTIALAGMVLIGIINLFFYLQAKALDEIKPMNSMQLDVLNTPMRREDQIILRLANNHVPDYPTSLACDYFASLVEERTDGRIKILNYHAAQLGDEKSTVVQVMYGGIDLARVSTALLTDYEPKLIALQMPYLYEDSSHMWTVLNSGIGDSFLQGLDEIGVEGLCWYDAGARNFYSVEPAFESVENLEGMKIRVQESSFMMDLISALGAVPEEIPFDKVAAALKRQEVDGAENNFSSYISTRHYLYAKYIMLDEHIRIPEVIIINKGVLDKLEERDQEIIRQAARDSSVRQRELWEEQEEENRRMVEEAGTVIREVKDKAAFIEKVQPVYQKYGGDYQEILEEIRKMGREKAQEE